MSCSVFSRLIASRFLIYRMVRITSAIKNSPRITPNTIWRVNLSITCTCRSYLFFSVSLHIKHKDLQNLKIAISIFILPHVLTVFQDVRMTIAQSVAPSDSSVMIVPRASSAQGETIAPNSRLRYVWIPGKNFMPKLDVKNSCKRCKGNV